MNKYNNGKIYKIISNETDKIYIGSTTKTLDERLRTHKYDYKYYSSGKYHYISSFEIVKYEDCNIILLENFPCNSKKELQEREQHYIKNNLNCFNKYSALRTKEDKQKYMKDYNKKYNELNFEELKEKDKIYYELNKEIIKSKNNKHYHQNKEKINEDKKIKYTCSVCGAIIRKSDKSRHEKTNKHIKQIKPS